VTADEGKGLIAKLPVLVPVPDGVVTLIEPAVAPVGNDAVIWVALFTVFEAASIPLNLTDVAPVKFVPVIMTGSPEPEQAPVGEKFVIAGINETV
jgi:hypothetical protein